MIVKSVVSESNILNKLGSTLPLDCDTGCFNNPEDRYNELPKQDSVTDTTEKLLQVEDEQMNILPISRGEFTICMISIVVVSVVLMIQLL